MSFTPISDSDSAAALNVDPDDFVKQATGLEYRLIVQWVSPQNLPRAPVLRRVPKALFELFGKLKS